MSSQQGVGWAPHPVNTESHSPSRGLCVLSEWSLGGHVLSECLSHTPFILCSELPPPTLTYLVSHTALWRETLVAEHAHTQAKTRIF